ncbi:MAG: aldo/keto reductase [Myxococcaceae bacterium]
MAWLDPTQLRVGLGVMRLSTEKTRDEAHARSVVHAALDEGLRVFDTARAYGLDEWDAHHNERWLGKFLREHGKGGEARVITKGGMRRDGFKWIPDGRAATLEAHCEKSLEALGRPIDLYLLHVPDPKTPFATQVRALMSLRERGLVKAVGLSNVSRAQLDEAVSLGMDVAAVQLGLSLLDDSAIRGGVVAGALSRDITVLCHSPLGGPKKFEQLGAQPWLVAQAREAGCSPWEWALASLLALSPQLMVLPGARRVETVRSCRRAADVKYVAPSKPAPPPPAPAGVKVHLLMGIQGAGKTTAVERLVGEGFSRLNRDDEGGTLEKLHARIGPLLKQGKPVVLDNTYVTRAQRAGAIAAAHQHGAEVHGTWHEIEPAQAQVNIVLRMLAVHGRLLTPAELKKGKTPDSLSPTAHQRTLRTVEVPGDDEGFSSVQRVAFARRGWPWEGTRAALFVGLEAMNDARLGAVPAEWPRIVVGWKEGGGVVVPAGFVDATCPHEGGPPVCWCRPPFPGAVLAQARALGIGFAESLLVSDSPSLQRLAAALGIPVAR